MANWIKHNGVLVNLDKVCFIEYDNDDMNITFVLDYNENYVQYDFKNVDAYMDAIEFLSKNLKPEEVLEL